MSASKMLRDLDEISDEEDDLMIMMMISSKKKKKKFVPSRNRHAFMQSLTADQRRLRTQYIPRCALQDPELSAFPPSIVQTTIRLSSQPRDSTT